MVGGIAESPARTIIAGLLLFLAVSIRGSPAGANRVFRLALRKLLRQCILVAVVLGAAAIITRGNAGPPPDYIAGEICRRALAKGKQRRRQLISKSFRTITRPAYMRLSCR